MNSVFMWRDIQLRIGAIENFTYYDYSGLIETDAPPYQAFSQYIKAISSTYLVISRISWRMTWQKIAKEHVDRVNAAIPKEWRIDKPVDGVSVMAVPKTSGILTPQEVEITESTATDLVKKMAARELSSVAVTTAFCKRAALAHQLGLETTMGYVAWIGKYDTEDSVLVTLLYNAGAVFFCKTSVPQSLMVCEVVNNIIGRTVNPRNKNWSCGGSSGGEGAMVGLRGGIIGIGTDIGGSIRIPSAFNFLYGLRPSHGRLPYGKMANSMEGQETVHSVCGPLTHSIADMKLFMTSVLAESPWSYDSKVIPMPWRQSEEDAVKAKIDAGHLVLGFYNCDGEVLPHPPILRGVQMVVDTMKAAGHTVVPWEPYRHPYAVDLINKIYASDGGTDIHTVLKESGEPAIPNISDLVNPALPKVDMNELWDIQLKKWKFQSEYLEKIRTFEKDFGKELDAIIAPITPTAAVRHNQFKYYGYASAINLLDYTSVVVPVTFADKSIDKKNESFKPLTNMDATVQAEYDPEAYHGAPVAVQIIGRRLTEERVMAIAGEIGKLLGNEVIP
ncbi:amidase [Geosmithia morbida]|uniref:amidase n=1 Tax=Geosmithia morbida TaxID=1094350 RepID=A0A9P4YNK5_9HYPO|nr:amidase [Geosmithia morbida]KAF4120248.1 amidase [Geosmithia morbida]